MIQPTPKKSGSAFETIDPRKYITGGIFREADFRDALKREDWSQFHGKRVLVKGCGKPATPPWAYMLILSHLGDYPVIVAYGEECAPIVVHRQPRRNDGAGGTAIKGGVGDGN